MLKMLGRLYLIFVVTYGVALYVIPDVVMELFDDRSRTYSLEQTRGTLVLIKQRFAQTPEAAWPALERALHEDFAPLQLRVLDVTDNSLSPKERAALAAGDDAVRLGDYGTLAAALTPLNGERVVELLSPPPPVDINMIYWLMNILVGAALLGCLLAWLRPHWRDLQRLKHTALLLGQGQLAERTHIPPRSNIGELAQVFDTMAQDIETLLNQQQELLNAVSHELRTPLSRLEFGMALVLADELQPPTRARLQQMVEHIRALDSLIGELLSYNRLQTPYQMAAIENVPLHAYLDSLLGEYLTEQEGRGYQITLSLEHAPERFALDPRLTARALQNLISNAIRYCEKRVHIMVMTAGSQLLASVEDDGIGIPANERQRVFEPFYRMDRSRDRVTGGFGLGLAISKRAIDCQGGHISVSESRYGGARFEIALPDNSSRTTD